MTHAIFAVLFQCMTALLTGRWLVGGLLASAFFVGREIAQAEYRWIQLFGEGRRENMPLWGGLDPTAWTMKSYLDAGLPVLAILLVFKLAAIFRSH